MAFIDVLEWPTAPLSQARLGMEALRASVLILRHGHDSKRPFKPPARLVRASGCTTSGVEIFGISP